MAPWPKTTKPVRGTENPTRPADPEHSRDVLRGSVKATRQRRQRMAYKDPAAQREYQRRWWASRRQSYLNKMGPCQACGSTKNLVFHHVDPDQKVSHNIWSWSRSRIERELAKCTVLCAQCHTQHHLGKAVTHGTHTGYSYYGCRCDRCREAQNRYVREWRKQRRATSTVTP